MESRSTEDGIDDVVSTLQRRSKVFCEWDVETLQLVRETLRKSANLERGEKNGRYRNLIGLIFALFWIINRRLVAVMPQMTCGYKTIAP